MIGYIVSCVVLGLILIAFVPAIIASHKNYSFTAWYFYGVIFFPIALAEAIKLKKPVRKINVLMSGEGRNRKKKTYLKAYRKKERYISFPFILAVFVTKLFFGLFIGLAAYALARMFFNDSPILRGIYISFSLIYAMLLSYTQICEVSTFPVLADEITKRALLIIAISAAASLPMFLLKNIITVNVSDNREFIRFICTLSAFVIFMALVFRMQRRYYGLFAKFFDYAGISMFAYVFYASVMLVAMSLSKGFRVVANALAMQLQLFNFKYFENIGYIGNLPSIYAAAAVHFVVLLLLAVSGWQCCKYKKKELEYRIEYRTKAFRMSRKRVLRRHVSKAGTVVKPLK